ncbi:response regulator [Salibacter halophilus]|uniref:Response regulator n=1 Tax=Salibacter halophilus TaxID=1803916 RepID=A0A6N6M7F1_9FLAO|nr:response regulator [Salibacter halophilus]KAB1065998.1 response regulator [Salibacter halophilus]
MNRGSNVLKVLLVDDQKITNFINLKVFEMVSVENQTIDYTDPEIAFRELDNHNPDIIFLDLMMPRLNGWEFLDRMKSQKIELPVVILSSSTSPEDFSRAEQYNNVLDYFTKPLQRDDIEKLLAKL